MLVYEYTEHEGVRVPGEASGQLVWPAPVEDLKGHISKRFDVPVSMLFRVEPRMFVVPVH